MTAFESLCGYVLAHQMAAEREGYGNEEPCGFSLYSPALETYNRDMTLHDLEVSKLWDLAVVVHDGWIVGTVYEGV